MKTFTTLCTAALGCLLSTTHLHAHFQADFSQPPYQLDETVIDVEGWAKSTYESDADENANVVTVPWGDAVALRLERQNHADAHTRLKNESFTPIKGQAKVTLEMAFRFPEANSGTSVSFGFYDLSSNHSPITLMLGFEEGGGLDVYVHKTSERIRILNKEEISQDAFYTFTFVVDPTQKIFDLEVTGTKADDSPFSLSETGIVSGDFSGNEIRTIYFGSSAPPEYAAYIRNIKVEAP